MSQTQKAMTQTQKAMTPPVRIVVIGAGPAGIAAATAAALAGAHVTVLDDNPSAGGQIWRSATTSSPAPQQDKAKHRALTAFAHSGATLLPGHRVVDATTNGTLQVLEERSAAPATLKTIPWDRLILATGARERFLPFPGWTLPGIFGAGGLQALVKNGFDVTGRRTVIAGTGPLLLAVAAHLKQDGAQIACVAEQAPLRSLLPFALQLWSHPAKLLDGARFRLALAHTPYRTGCWPVAALGRDKLEAVRLTDGRRTWVEPCTLLACGFHLVPNTELAALLGCRLEDGAVLTNSTQQTSHPTIYAAGEPTGIAGLDAALIEGRIAGLHAAGQTSQAARLQSRSARQQSFGRRLTRAFALRPELRTLSTPDTIVCRCEDVRFNQLSAQPAITCWTDAKLLTRCGMGPCQGRICGPAVDTIFGWTNSSVRPPIFPIPLAALAAAQEPTSPAPTALQEIR